MYRIYDVNGGSYDVAKGFEGQHIEIMVNQNQQSNNKTLMLIDLARLHLCIENVM